MIKQTLGRVIFLCVLLSLGGCVSSTPPTPTPTPIPLAEEITLYNWVDYMPLSVLDAFTEEYSVKVNYVTFDTMEEAVATVLEGSLDFDVAVADTDTVARLVAGNALSEIDYRHIPNFANISPNFRDLAYDPDNQYSVPYNWGTTGLLVRRDLVDPLPTRWADLWDPRFAGRIAVREEPTELIGIALKSLGYSLNSKDPAQLEEASARLFELKKLSTFASADGYLGTESLLSGEDWILVGWPGDILIAREENPAILYILPQDGTLLWGDSFVISANSRHQDTAELFINFVLQPEISAEIVEQYYYPTANESALELLDPAIRNDVILFPPPEDIRKGEWYIPPSPEVQKIYDDIWARLETDPWLAR